jgi:hypothetical protein
LARSQDAVIGSTISMRLSRLSPTRSPPGCRAKPAAVDRNWPSRPRWVATSSAP